MEILRQEDLKNRSPSVGQGMTLLQECILKEVQEIRKYQEASEKDRQVAAMEWIRNNAKRFREEWNRVHNK